MPKDARFNLIDQAYQALNDLSTVLTSSKIPKVSGIKILTEEERDNLKDAFRYVKDFLEFWQKLLPNNASDYIFNYIAEFTPTLKGNKIKFELALVLSPELCSKECRTLNN